MICYIRALQLARSRALSFALSLACFFYLCRRTVMMILLNVVPVICLYRISVTLLHVHAATFSDVCGSDMQKMYILFAQHTHTPVNGMDENVGLAPTDRISLFRLHTIHTLLNLFAFSYLDSLNITCIWEFSHDLRATANRRCAKNPKRWPMKTMICETAGSEDKVQRIRTEPTTQLH